MVKRKLAISVCLLMISLASHGQFVEIIVDTLAAKNSLTFENGGDLDYEYIFAYPVNEGDNFSAIRESMIKNFFFTDEPDMHKAAQGYEANIILAVESREPGEAYSHIGARYCSLEIVNNKVLSCEMNIYIYAGGAHGDEVFYYYNYDLQTGRLIRPEDLFKSDRMADVLPLIVASLESSQDSFGARVEDVYLTNNYFITNDSIVFFYNRYEIASYIYGVFGFPVKYSELEDLLTDTAKGYFQ